MTTATLETTAFRTTEEILALLRAFHDCTLPRADWTHAAHLTVALWHLLQYDWPESVARVRRGIKRYNAAHGIVTTPTGGYHETLTIFWLRRVRSKRRPLPRRSRQRTRRDRPQGPPARTLHARAPVLFGSAQRLGRA